MNYKVIEIFDTLEGEGLRSGMPTTFVRLYGCNLRCSYCDTEYSFDDSVEPKIMSLESIMDSLNKCYKRVTLTGGEPLYSDKVELLIKAMCDNGYQVNIETNGAVDLQKIVDLRVSNNFDFMISVDYKLFSSGIQNTMIQSNFDLVDKQDIVKFVIGSTDDITQMLTVIKQHELDKTTNIVVGAVYGRYDLHSLADNILKEPLLHNAKLQIQLHKVIGIA